MPPFNWKDSQKYGYNGTVESNGDMTIKVNVGGVDYRIYYTAGDWTYESGANSLIPSFISGRSEFNQDALDRLGITTDLGTLTGELITKGNDALSASLLGPAARGSSGPQQLDTLIPGARINQTGNRYEIKNPALGNARFMMLNGRVVAIPPGAATQQQIDTATQIMSEPE